MSMPSQIPTDHKPSRDTGGSRSAQPAETTKPRRPALGVERKWLIRLALALICLFPIGLSNVSVGDTYGPTEEGVNATIWALGGRNILQKGPVDARFGADLSPYWLKHSGGIYSHHPPLPVWASAAVQLLGRWDGWFRLFALSWAAAALLILYRTMRELVAEELALAGTLVAATTGYLLSWGRMFTTLTLAAPLFMWLLYCALGRIFHERKLPRSFWPVLVLTTFSSWDGVAGAGAIAGVLALDGLRRSRCSPVRVATAAAALAPLGLYVLCLGALTVHFYQANDGLTEMITQAKYRSGSLENQFTWGQWLKLHLKYFTNGLGWFGFFLLLAAPVALWFLRERKLLVALLLSSVPAVAMTVLMRHGAYYHPFWAYNLFLPMGFAAAGAIVLARRWNWKVQAGLLAALGVQALINIGTASSHIGYERMKNAVGALVKRYPKDQPAIRVLSSYNFHPYLTWYSGLPEDIAFDNQAFKAKLESGNWAPEDPLLVDTLHTHYAGCRPMIGSDRSSDWRWIMTSAAQAREACGIE
jgi:hypothetical protein